MGGIRTRCAGLRDTMVHESILIREVERRSCGPRSESNHQTWAVMTSNPAAAGAKVLFCHLGSFKTYRHKGVDIDDVGRRLGNTIKCLFM